MKEKSGKLAFKVDFPSLYGELVGPGNVHNIGPGGAMGLRTVLLGLRRIALLSIEKNDVEICEALEALGIVD